MAKKALLLFSQVSIDAGMTHPDDLVRLLNEASDQLEAAPAILENLLFYMGNEGIEVIDSVSGRSLTEYDIIYFRFWGQTQGHAIAAARFCKLKGIPFVDSEVLRVGSQNKITQYMNLVEAKVPIPKTLIGKTASLLGQYRRFGFTFPIIIKAVGATRGADNFKLEDEADMRDIFARYPNTTFALQSFVPNEGDYRVLVMGDRVVALVERTPKNGSYLNNTSQGAAARLVPLDTLPQEVLDTCVRASAFFGRQIAGVDIVKETGTDQYYCFEVNRAPQIEHASFEKEKAALLAEYLTHEA
jgi:glutathione synthase/RimK-type ligase-like ATP-grasp enzyme